MNLQILAAIRGGGSDEIVELFRLRAEAMLRCADLEKQPALRQAYLAEKSNIKAIDNYMRAKLQPVCRIDGEFILGFADQCQSYDQIGFAPGDLDVTESGQRFINPSLPGYVMWGVFETTDTGSDLVLPPVTIRHVDADDLDVTEYLRLSKQHTD